MLRNATFSGFLQKFGELVVRRRKLLINNDLRLFLRKYSVNPWLRVVTRLSLFGCDEPSSTEPRWIVAITG